MILVSACLIFGWRVPMVYFFHLFSSGFYINVFSKEVPKRFVF